MSWISRMPDLRRRLAGPSPNSTAPSKGSPIRPAGAPTCGISRTLTGCAIGSRRSRPATIVCWSSVPSPISTPVARPLLAACPRGIIHGDLNDENVLVAGAAVAGLIDFGDALENPLVCDLAIAVAYLTLGSSDPLTLGAAIVAGYESVRRLQPAERDALGALVRARLAVSVVVAAGRRAAGEDRPSLFVSERAAWAGLRLLDTIPADERTLRLFPGEPGMHTADDAQTESLLAARKKLIGGGLSLSYQRPLHFVKGRAQYLFDPHGEAHLDLVNNVCHVGHCHPRVVAAARHQMGELNTNSRYLYHELTGYAERLAALLPEPLSVCYIVNSGSEAE